MKNRTALYLRVSTDGQTVENQRIDLEKYAELRSWKIVATYVDEGISGSKGRDKRPGLKQMIDDAKKRRFDRLLCWSIDRLGRSAAIVAPAMDELRTAGVAQFYFKESMDGSTPHGAAMLEMAAVFAKLEREMIVGRVNAGLARVRAADYVRPDNKKEIGRPALDGDKEQRVKQMLADQVGIGKIARTVRVGVSTVKRIKYEMDGLSGDKERRVKQMLADQIGIGEIARTERVGVSTLKRIKAEMEGVRA